MNHPISRRFILLALPVIAAVLLYTSCSHKRVVIPAFYYWKTTFNLNGTEQQLLDSTSTKLLYIHFFDVDQGWKDDNFPLPEGKLEFKQTVPSAVQVIPVVYITNKALGEIDASRINELAIKIRRKVDKMCAKNRIAQPKEYQLDCDWTDKTREKYFALVTAYKQQITPAKLSVTIRLHQYKYASKTGIPNADRGLLMLYNTGHLQDEDDKNYILDIEEASKYLTNKAVYKLPLDIGLPVYSQGVCYLNAGYSNNITLMAAEEVDVDIANGWLKPLRDNWYVDTTGKDGTSPHYYSGDAMVKIRYEKISPQKLMEAAKLVHDRIADDTCRVVFFHLDSFQCSKFSINDFNKVVRSF